MNSQRSRSIFQAGNRARPPLHRQLPPRPQARAYQALRAATHSLPPFRNWLRICNPATSPWLRPISPPCSKTFSTSVNNRVLATLITITTSTPTTQTPTRVPANSRRFPVSLAGQGSHSVLGIWPRPYKPIRHFSRTFNDLPWVTFPAPPHPHLRVLPPPQTSTSPPGAKRHFRPG